MFDEVSIKRTLEKIDLQLRPQALIFHPSRARELGELIPNIEEKVLLMPTMAIEEDVMYLVDRAEIEKWEPVPQKFEYGGSNQNENLD